MQIVYFLIEKTARCLRENGFDENARRKSVDAKYLRARPALLDDAIREPSEGIAEQYDAERLLSNPVRFESPESTVNVCIDDVTVKRQEPERPKGLDEPSKKKERKPATRLATLKKEIRAILLTGGRFWKSCCFW